MKIVIFGVGEFYQKRKEKLDDKTEVIAFVDNNSELWGSSIDGIAVYAPAEIEKFSYDAIVLMSLRAHEMKQQLLRMGINEKKILYFNKFYGNMHKGETDYYYADNVISKTDNNVVIITTKMDYNGGSLAAIYAAMALSKLNYSVSIATHDINSLFMKEMINKGFNFIIYKNLPYASDEELEWLNKFKYVICNTFQMIQCVKTIESKRRVIWWIHECRSLSEYISEEFSSINAQNLFNTFIYTVGNRCKDVFNDIYPLAKVNIMQLGIPDIEKKSYKENNDKVIFAIIGGISPLKSQEIFLKAVSRLSREEKDKAEFWIIGNISNASYAEKVYEMANDEDGVKILGLKTRDEMKRLYSLIDVVVCASKEETGPITVMEGMMFGKVCITTNTTEMAAYIQNGKNGYVCETQNVNALFEKMKWLINHRESLQEIGDAARKIYEDNFTISKLGQRLEQNLLLMDKTE